MILLKFDICFTLPELNCYNHNMFSNTTRYFPKQCGFIHFVLIQDLIVLFGERAFKNKVNCTTIHFVIQVEPVRRSLQQCKGDNTKMAASIETLMKSNGQLQAAVDNLEDKLDQKNHLLTQTQASR